MSELADGLAKDLLEACNEIDRLRASNAELVAALGEARAALDTLTMPNGSDGGLACMRGGNPVGKIIDAAIEKANAKPKLEPQTYKIQPPTFVPKG